MKAIPQIFATLLIFNISFSQLPDNYKGGPIFVEDESGIVEKTIIAKLNPEYSHLRNSELILQTPYFQHINQILGIESIRELFPFVEKPEKTYNEYGEKLADITGIFEIKYSNNIPINQAIALIYKSDFFYYTVADYLVEPLGLDVFTPNDPHINDQWYLTKIMAYDAWDINQGNPSIIIGSVDAGIRINHPDLVNNLYVNTGEIPSNGIDDDGDGFIDNYNGWNFFTGNDNVAPFTTDHGVWVAGIHSATVDNSIGIAGVGFNSKYLAVSITNGAGGYARSYEGLVYAAMRSHVVNCSWGGALSSQITPYIDDVINFVTVNLKKLIVASSGNDGLNNTLRIPSSHPNVLSVGMTNSNDERRPQSNIGFLLDVMSPGQNIWSTIGINTYNNVGNGTSFAAPIVSGIAAVTKAQFPAYDMIQVGEKVKYSTDDIYSVGINSTLIDRLGTGRVNYLKALQPTTLSSIKFINREYQTPQADAMLIGDTVFIRGIFLNYLEPSSNATVAILSSTSPHINIINNTFNVGALNTYQNISNQSSPFKFVILQSCPIDHIVEFRLDIVDGGHSMRQHFQIIVNNDFVNIKHNKIETTLTSIGRNGFRDGNINRTLGRGLRFNQSINYLINSGLITGHSPIKVSDVVLGDNWNFWNNDFEVSEVISNINQGIHSADYTYKSVYNDYNSGLSKQDIEITQFNYVWKNAPYDNFIIYEYVIKNNSANTINNFYAGWFNFFQFLNQNFTDPPYNLSYIPSHKTGYFVCNSVDSNFIIGAKILTSNTTPTHYANQIQGIIGSSLNILDGFTKVEKYLIMSQGLTQTSITNNYSTQFIGEGPFTIQPGESITIALAFIMTDQGLADLIASAANAQNAYDNLACEWIGTLNSDWNNPVNWRRGIVPTNDVDVYIRASTNHPNLPVGTTQLKSLTIDDGATLYISASSILEIKDFLNDKSTSHRDFGDGSIKLNGIAAQQISANFSIGNLTLDNINGISLQGNSDLRIKNELSLISGNFNVPINANVTLISTPSQTAYLNDFMPNNGSYAGQITVERLMTHSGSQKKFHFITPSVSGVTVDMWADDFPLEPLNGAVDGSQIIPQPNCSQQYLAMGSPYGNLQEYLENAVTNCYLSGWHIRMSGNLTVGRGYAARVNSGIKATAKGNPNTGNISFNGLTRTATNLAGPGRQGFNLVGNPYPSGLNWDAVANDNPQISATAYLYDPNTNIFLYYHPIANPGQTIASGQGFQVELLNGPTGSLQFKNEHRVASSTPTFFNQNQNLTIKITAPTHSDKWFLTMDNAFSDQWDSRWDAHKLELNGISEIFSIKENFKSAVHTISSQNSFISIPLHFVCRANGDYGFEVELLPENYAWKIIDHKLNTENALTANTNFLFASLTSDIHHRFTINAIPIPEFDIQTKQCESMADVSFQNLSNEHWIIEIFDEMNNVVCNHTLVDSLLINSLPAGNYTMVLNQPDFQFSQTIDFEIENAILPTASFSTNQNSYLVNEVIHFSNQSLQSVNFYWDFDDGNFSTDFEPTHQYLQSGVYQVQLTAANGYCEDRFSKMINILHPSNISEISSPKVKFYIFQKRAFIELSEFEKVPYLLTIYDLSGKLIFNQNIKSQSAIIDLSFLKSGIYAFQISNESFSESYKWLIE